MALAFVLGLGTVLPVGAQDTNSVSSDSINFPNAPVGSILDFYEQLSGKHLIRDAQLAGMPPISIIASGMSKTDRLKLIEETLLLNGVAIIPLDDHNAKVVTVTAKNPRVEGVKLYANAADLPKDDQVVSYYMPLSYIGAQEVQAIFTQHAPVHQPYGQYVPVPSAQAIVLTENVSVIRQLIALKELIDVPPAKVVSEFIPLQRADAEKVADTLNKMLDPKSNPAAAAQGPGGNVIVPSGVGNDSPLSNEHNLLSGSAQIVADVRSNSIWVVTRPVNMPFLKELVTQLDQPDIYTVPQRRPLRYVLAQDILPAIETALAQGKDEQDQVKKDQTGTPGTNANGAGGGGAAAPRAPSASSGSSAATSSSVTPDLQAPAQNNVPTVVTIGKTRIMADNRSNTIIVFGSPDATSRVFSMIDQLDQKPLQVYLATVIGQLTVTGNQEFGIDILQKFQKVGQGGLATSQQVTSASGSVPEPRSLLSSTGFPLTALTGLNLYGAIGSTLDAYVRALDATGRFKMISRPSVYTTNNKLAVIADGEQVPVPSNITSGNTGANNTLTTTASVQYENILVQLDIIPLINASHEVTLQIKQTNNTEGGNVTISNNTVPIIKTQEINTEVTVPNKSTVVIGGLISNQTTRDTTGVPWLSDIPLLGYLFKDTTKSKQRDELIIMIQPTVIETDADQIAADKAEKERTILGREAEAAASGVLPEESFSLLAPRTGADNNVDLRSTSYNPKVGVSPRTEQPPATTTVTTTTVSQVSSHPAATTAPNAPKPVSSGDASQVPKVIPAPSEEPTTP